MVPPQSSSGNGNAFGHVLGASPRVPRMPHVAPCPAHPPTYLRRYTIFSGMFWFLFPASLVVGNDCFAYIAGQIAGKKIFGNVRRLPSLLFGYLGAAGRGMYRLGGLSRDCSVHRVVCSLVVRPLVCLFACLFVCSFACLLVCLFACCICGNCSACSSSSRPTRRGKGSSAGSCSRISTRLSLRQCGAPPHSPSTCSARGAPCEYQGGPHLRRDSFWSVRASD